MSKWIKLNNFEEIYDYYDQYEIEKFSSVLGDTADGGGNAVSTNFTREGDTRTHKATSEDKFTQTDWDVSS
jgi:hypothetical protein